MKNLEKCKCAAKEIFLVWLIVLVPIYTAVMAEKTIQAVRKALDVPRPAIKVTPDIFQPAEIPDYAKKVCSIKKVLINQKPLNIIV